MKRNIFKRVTAFAMSVILTGSLVASAATPASAAENTDSRIPTIRANGFVVEFPDAQPYITENGRTMLPIRFVTEALGADVSWDNARRTAIITKNGITVELPINSNQMTVIKDGESSVVTIDEVAALVNDRTMVPIRHVAEALGAYVDYSSYYNVVGIYNDVLTKEQIEWLRSFDLTLNDDAFTYEENKAVMAKHPEWKDTLGEKNVWGTDEERASFENEYGYANRRECAYANLKYYGLAHNFNHGGSGLKFESSEEFYAAVIEEAKANINYESENVKFEFITDASCVYHSDDVLENTIVVRGVVLVTPKKQPFASWSQPERLLYDKTGTNRLHIGGTYAMPIDIHMAIDANRTCMINCYMPLLDPDETIVAVPCTCEKCVELGQDWYMPWAK